MRMDPTEGETCLELLQRLGQGDLARVIKNYGEERVRGARIARAIKDALAEDRIATTLDLASVIADAVPTRERMRRKTDPATRTFQALRIVVNDELTDVERLLADFPGCLKDDGRFVAIAFHSLEDGPVKNRLRDLSRHPGLPADIALQMGIRPDSAFELLTRQPVVPSTRKWPAIRARGRPSCAPRERIRSRPLPTARRRGRAMSPPSPPTPTPTSRWRRPSPAASIAIGVFCLAAAALGHVHLRLRCCRPAMTCRARRA